MTPPFFLPRHTSPPQLAHAAVMVNFPKALQSYCRHERCKNHQDWRVSQYKVSTWRLGPLLSRSACIVQCLCCCLSAHLRISLRADFAPFCGAYTMTPPRCAAAHTCRIISTHTRIACLLHIHVKLPHILAHAASAPPLGPPPQPLSLRCKIPQLGLEKKTKVRRLHTFLPRTRHFSALLPPCRAAAAAACAAVAPPSLIVFAG
jgi:hypothetical protein